MELTAEQIAILKTNENIRVAAVAGSGKTTTLIAYAKSRPAGSKILYLAFNRSVRQEATGKFLQEGLPNVKVETAHSLAYKHIVGKNGYKVKSQAYRFSEIAEILQLQSGGEKHTEFIVANHISKFISYYCNSDTKKIEDLDYLKTVTDAKARSFVQMFYKLIVKMSALFIRKMEHGEIEITHDFYLKKFQLSCPDLGYDYILFDEGQDASAAMLDIFLRQRAVKVIVGDPHQQIYSWRFAVNSLAKVDFPSYPLSFSFRFGNDIAVLARNVVSWKRYLLKTVEFVLEGNGKEGRIQSKAVIARTNLGLLLKAIEYVTGVKALKQIYFEGNINSYTYADDGTSLYDVLNLYNGRAHLIRDHLVRSMKDLVELEDYIKKAEDSQLSMMVEIVKKYGNEIPEILRRIKSCHVDNENKYKAEMIFSTVHRCKGMEYDEVELVNDFVTEEKLKKYLEGKKEDADPEKLNEEINLLYVAVTRTRQLLRIPPSLLPEGHLSSPKIILVEPPKAAVIPAPPSWRSRFIEEKLGRTIEQDRSGYIRGKTGKKWSFEDQEELRFMYAEGIPIEEMASRLERTEKAVWYKMMELELEGM